VNFAALNENTEEDEKAFPAELRPTGTLGKKEEGEEVEKEGMNEGRKNWVKHCVKGEVDFVFVFSAAEGTAENLIST
jgi:hypothetical protein